MSFCRWFDSCCAGLSFWRRIGFLVLLLSIGAVNLTVFVSNVNKLTRARGNPISELSRQEVTTFPQFSIALYLIPTDLGQLQASDVFCYDKATNYTQSPNSAACTLTQFNTTAAVPGFSFAGGVSVTPTFPFNPLTVAQSLQVFMVKMRLPHPKVCGTVLLFDSAKSWLDIIQNPSVGVAKICYNDSYSAQVYATQTIFVDGTSSWDFTLQTTAIAAAEDNGVDVAHSAVMIFTNLFTAFSVQIDRRIIAYDWVDLLTATAGLLSMSISVILFAFPSVPLVAHRRKFMLDRLCSSKNWNEIDANREDSVSGGDGGGDGVAVRRRDASLSVLGAADPQAIADLAKARDEREQRLIND